MRVVVFAYLARLSVQILMCRHVPLPALSLDSCGLPRSSKGPTEVAWKGLAKAVNVLGLHK